MWGGIELRELEMILVLAEELHFGRTAERLGVSTANVSQTVRHVERRLGCQLFERTSRKVEPTLMGETVVRNLRPVVAELERRLAEAAATAAGLAGPLRIAHIMTVESVPRLAEVCAQFERRVPDVKIRRLRYDILNYVPALLSGEVDIWVTWWPFPAPQGDAELGLVCGPPITTQPAALLVGRSHPLAARASISLEDLADHPLIEFPPTVTISTEFKTRWVPRTTPSGAPVPRVSDPAWHGHFHELVPILERGTLGWYTISSFLDTITMPRSMTTVPIRDAPPFVLVPWWRAGYETPAIAAFAAVIEETSRKAQLDRDDTTR